MGFKHIHRWLGLVAGTLALVLGLSGALLAFDPVQQAWQAPDRADGLPVATLVERIQRSVPGAEEIRRLPSGAVVVFGFADEQPLAAYVDTQSGRPLGAYQPSALPRWVKNLHRQWLLGDAGRWGVAATALAMALLCASGLVLLLRRMGGWRHVAGKVRGSLAQRLHVLVGRVLLLVLVLSALTGLVMSASTLGLVALEPGSEPEVASSAAVTGQPPLPAAQIPFLQSLRVQDLRKLNLPDPTDPEDTWQVATRQGQGWIDRHTGTLLAWQDATTAQHINDWAVVLHTGEAAWPWAVVLGLAGASVLLFWATGLVIWWQARRASPRIAANRPAAQAGTLIFVASEGGSTWGFAQALHAALTQAGQRVHTGPLEQFHTTTATRQVFVLAATYGDGQAPAHARAALARIHQHAVGTAPVTVLGFGDRQYPAFCAYAQALEQALRARGWPALLPLECIHQQSAQQFARWGAALAQALGTPLVLDYRPRLPHTSALTLVARQDFTGRPGQPTAILRFAWPPASTWQRLRGQGLGPFAAGDLLGIVPPGSSVPRYYSLASASADGFVELCVRQMPGGLCSTHMLGLQTGQRVLAFVRPNPGFALPRGRQPVVLIGAGTGVAPLAGFIRRNTAHRPLYLYYGTRDPERDWYFGPELAQWQQEGRVARVQTIFSRVAPEAGYTQGYVQDSLRLDAAQLLPLLAQGALVRVCGSRPMAEGVARTLDELLAPQHLSVQQLRAQERYAEDLF